MRSQRKRRIYCPLRSLAEGFLKEASKSILSSLFRKYFYLYETICNGGDRWYALKCNSCDDARILDQRLNSLAMRVSETAKELSRYLVEGAKLVSQGRYVAFHMAESESYKTLAATPGVCRRAR